MIKKNITDIVTNLRHNKFIFLALIILLFISHYMVFDQVDWPKRYMLIAFFVIAILVIFLDFNALDKMPRNAFLIILLIGSMNSLILPAGTGLDEQSHYAKAMQIADGHFINQVDKQDFNLVSPDAAFNPEGQINKYNLYSPEWLQLMHVKSNYSLAKNKSYNIANPVFIPSAIGIKIGRLLSPKVYVSYYLGRIFNVLSFAAMAYIAIKKSRKYQAALFGMATLPWCLWISAGYNYDAFYYGLTLLVVSWLTNMLNDEKKIQMKDIVWYSVFSALLIFPKPPMVVMIVLPLFIPKSYYQTVKVKLLSIIPMIIGIFCSGLWLIQTRIFSLFGFQVASIQESNPEQISNITYFSKHFIETIEAFTRTFFKLLGESIPTQIATPNAHLAPPYLKTGHDISNNINLIIFILVLVLSSFVIKVNLPKYFKNILIGLNLFIIFATIYAIAGDTRVYAQGDTVIGGVQGRYAFVLLVMLPALLSSKIKKIFGQNSKTQLLNPNLEKYDSSLIIKLCLIGAFLTSCTNFYVTGYLLF